MKLSILFLVGLTFFTFASANNWNSGKDKCKTNKCNNNDFERYICTTDIAQDVTNVPVIPSGAPPTNDGFAYSQVSYTDNFLYIAGQNGYDSFGRLVARSYDYKRGISHSLTRIVIAFLNLLSATECFNINVDQIPGIIVTIANTWNDTRDTPVERIQKMLDERSLVNWVQAWFWGNKNKMTREFVLAEGLSRGDTFEVQALPIPRVNITKRTCLETNIPPQSAQILKTWTLTGNPPADIDAFLFQKTGYRLDRGLGPASNPEPRNDNWARTDIKPAPKFGDAGDILAAENWNPATIKTECVAIPARNDSLQFVPATNIFIRTAGICKPGEPVGVFLHGTSASESYCRSTAYMVSRKYCVILMDERGHGRSPVTPATVPYDGGFRYTYEAFADDVKAVLDAKNITEKIFFVGISIGGSIGLQFAAKYPEKMHSLVPISTAPLFRCADGTINGSIPTCAPTQPGGLVSWLTGTPTTPTTMLPEDKLSGCNVDVARAKIDQNRADNTSGVAVTSLLTYSQRVDQTDLLPKIKAPTLIIHGLADSTLGVSAAEALHKGIVNSVRLDFVNRGHLLPITSYVDVANNIIRFVQGHTFPEISRVIDRGCTIDPEVAPEVNFAKCPSV